MSNGATSSPLPPTKRDIGLVAGGLFLLSVVLVPWALFGVDYSDSPRRLAKLVGVGGILVLAGIVSIVVQAFRHPERSRALRRGFGFLGIVVILLAIPAVATLAYYVRAWDEAVELCRNAQVAPQLAQRRHFLDAASPARRRVAFFNETVFVCEEVDGDLARLQAGECPEYPPRDVRCRCGTQNYPSDWNSQEPAECRGYSDLRRLEVAPASARSRMANLPAS